MPDDEKLESCAMCRLMPAYRSPQYCKGIDCSECGFHPEQVNARVGAIARDGVPNVPGCITGLVWRDGLWRVEVRPNDN